MNKLVNIKETIENKQGSMIIFPSNLYHEVEPVTKGTRYSLVQWYKGYEN